MKPDKKSFIAVGAHMDDAFMGAGGVLLQAIHEGHRVVLVTIVSDYSTYINTKGREAETKDRLYAMADRYGYEQVFLDYPYHQIQSEDVEIKRKLAEIYLEVKPQAAFVHHTEDHFPDHVAAGKLAHDAFLFSHGLSSDMRIQRIPHIFSFSITPYQTYRFEEEVYYDIDDVMEEYMEALLTLDACLEGSSESEVLASRFIEEGDPGRSFALGFHGRLRLAECIRHGNRAGYRHAQAFRVVWGRKTGPEII